MSTGTQTVGVVGLGKMGFPIAVNLLDRGLSVVGYRRSGCPDLVTAGGDEATSPREVAERSDVLLTILPDTAALDDVLSGERGMLAGLRPGTVLIEMSTLKAADKAGLRDAVVAAGGDMLDCPISGTPHMVTPRIATTMASGDPESVDAVRPVLDAISGRWVYTGPFGSGARMKYIANMLLAVHTVAAAEAVTLARALDLDLELVQDTLDGTVASSGMWERRGPLMRERRYTPAPGPISTLTHILAQIDDAAQEVGVTLPLFTASKQLFDKAHAEGWGDLDIAAVHDQVSGAHRTP